MVAVKTCHKILNELKEKFYCTAIRLAMLYGSDYWALKESYPSIDENVKVDECLY